MRKNTRDRGRPRNELPFIEVRPGGRVRYRRKVPVDLHVVLGEAWFHNFEAGVDDQTIRQTAAALAAHHDTIVKTTRTKLVAMRGTAA